jgi:hypothetical protein
MIIPTKEDEQIRIETSIDEPAIIRSCSPAPQIVEQPPTETNLPVTPLSDFNHFSVTSSLMSSMTPVQPPIRVEIIEKQNPGTPHIPKPRQERASFQTPRQRKQSISPSKTPISEQTTANRYLYNPFLLDFSMFIISVNHFYQTIQICGIHMQNNKV